MIQERIVLETETTMQSGLLHLAYMYAHTGARLDSCCLVARTTFLQREGNVSVTVWNCNTCAMFSTEILWKLKFAISSFISNIIILVRELLKQKPQRSLPLQ